MFAQFHKAFWNEKSQSGIAKVHFEPLGIICFVFNNGEIKEECNLVDKDEIAYYQQIFRKAGSPLKIGVNINEVEILRVQESAKNYYQIDEIEIEIWREVDGECYWKKFSSLESNLIKFKLEYQRCDSLICIT